MENQWGRELIKWEVCIFASMNLNWIPLATILNCARDERLERRIRYQSLYSSFWRWRARQKPEKTRGQRVICNHDLSPSFWHRWESGA